jgi:tetratricopeptide (TPR) repeat protein
MPPVNWHRVAELYDAAMGKPPAERRAFLDAACAKEPTEVRAQVEALLQGPTEDDGPLFKHFEQNLTTLARAVTAELFLKEGTRLLDRYTIRSVLGIGGMGIVYAVEDCRFDPPCPRAVKMILPDIALALGLEARRRFKDEANVLARLTDERFVRVYDIDEWNQQLFLVLELVNGRSLKDRCPSKLPPKEAARLIASLADAMSPVHRLNIVHRDLKPANILLDDRQRPKITDFGIGVIGTPGYMAPEQCDGDTDRVHPAADIYALGAILYELLTGGLPYDPKGAPSSEFRRAVTDPGSKPLRPRRLERTVPADLAAICLKCLEKEREDRYGTAKDLADDLQRFLDGKPVWARPAGALRKLWMWACRRPAQALAAALAVLLLLAVFINERANQRHLADTVERERRERELTEEKAKAERDRLAAEKARHDEELKRLAAEKAREAEKRQNAIDKALTAAMGADLEAADKAIAEAERAGASPGQVRMLRGQIALHRGQSRKAMEHLEQAVQLLPESVAARGMLAAAYASDGHWERYDKTIRKMEQLTPSTPEDFLFKGYAEANLDPKLGLQTIKQAFDRRPNMPIALLIRAEVLAYHAQDTDDLAVAEEAVEDARFAKRLLGNKNPAALWVSLNAHLAKAGVHEHRAEEHRAEPERRRAELERRRAELELAGEYAKALKPFTELPILLPEAVVYRWLYFREMGSEEEVLQELRRASEQTDHVYVAFCYALTLYRRGQRGDFEEALRVLEKRHPSYNDRLRAFVLAEHDWPNRDRWPARALKAYEDFAEWAQDVAALMDSQAVRCLLGKKGDAVKASKALLKRAEGLYTLRREPLLRCLRYNAGELPEDDLIQGAKGSRWDQCLAHYYVAMTKLATGDRDEAREHFDKVVKTRAFIWGTYDMSWVFLDRLKDPTWPAWPLPRRAK